MMAGSLFDLIGLITPGHSVRHEAFQFVVLYDLEAAWWIIDASGVRVWKFPVYSRAEAIEAVGAFVAADPGWILR